MIWSLGCYFSWLTEIECWHDIHDSWESFLDILCPWNVSALELVTGWNSTTTTIIPQSQVGKMTGRLLKEDHSAASNLQQVENYKLSSIILRMFSPKPPPKKASKPDSGSRWLEKNHGFSSLKNPLPSGTPKPQPWGRYWSSQVKYRCRSYSKSLEAQDT